MSYADKFYIKEMNVDQQQAAKKIGLSFAVLADIIEGHLEGGRYKSLVLTKLEESAMFATKSIIYENN